MEGVFHKMSVSDSWSQVLVQTALYGYVLFVAANMIGDGAELLLLVPSVAQIVGSIVLPILGAVPDGMMVLCSGLGPDAQEQVSVGVGALAGSTIMLLTLPWFLSVFAGRVTIDRDSEYGERTLRYTCPNDASRVTWTKLDPEGDMSLFHTGVRIGKEIQTNAWLMVATSSSYLIIQFAAFIVDSPGSVQTVAMLKGEASFENPFAQAGLCLSIAWFVWYLYYMYKEGQHSDGTLSDKIVKTTVEGIQQGQLTLRGAMAQFRERTWDSLCNNGASVGLEESLLNHEDEEGIKRMCRVLRPFFHYYDKDRDSKIDQDEFRMILQDLHEAVSPQAVKHIFHAADADQSGFISFDEFLACMMAFALDPNDSMLMHVEGGKSKRLPTDAHYLEDSGEAHGISADEDDADEEDMPEDLADLPHEEQQRRLKMRALYAMTVGSALVLVFSDPMTDMLGIIGDKAGIPKFYVAFVLAPLASNASELVSAMRLARKRTIRSMVQALSTLEGAAIMNNTFCLAIFLSLIVVKNLVWKFAAETISILVIQALMGVMAITKPIHTLFDGVVIFMFYPLALVIVYCLENFFLWD